ncbi:MAG: aminotransferase class V-fold PLP-dependent enzyme [Verrucomicrobiia bacterium]
MASLLDELVADEARRRKEFPVAGEKIFLGHAGVTVLPRVVAEAVAEYTWRSSKDHQEFGDVLRRVDETRVEAACLIGAEASEIALLGPTSLGLSLFANGIPWEAGDEVLCYFDDYPANVYPWLELRRQGVVVRFLKPSQPGAITPDLVFAAITPRTRLVALASAHFLTGYRIDIDSIGLGLRERGILFSLDAIQTLGAFPTRVTHVDFMSADAHKWLLGPLAVGIVYVAKRHFDLVRPTLVGAWNGVAPDFISQPEVTYPRSGRRYEPGVLNVAGIFGMAAAIRLLTSLGIERVAERIMDLKESLVLGLEALGFEIFGPRTGDSASGITTCHHPTCDLRQLFQHLEASGVVCSLRKNRAGQPLLRFSPHFYNTKDEIGHVVDLIARFLRG